MKTRALLTVFLSLLLLAGCTSEKKLYQYPIEGAFTTNVYENPKKYLKCSMELNVYDTIKAETLTEKIGAIRDTIIKVLRGKDEVALSAVDIQDTLSLEVSEALNTLLEDEYVVSVVFTDFIVS